MKEIWSKLWAYLVIPKKTEQEFGSLEEEKMLYI